MSKRRILLYTILTILVGGFLYLYIWEKPKLEKVITKYIESMSQGDDIPFAVKIGNTNFSIIPLQLEIYDAELKPKKDLGKKLKSFKISKVAVRPSLLDLLIGKFWISKVNIEKSKIDVTLNEAPIQGGKTPNLEIDLNGILKRIPLSQINIQDIVLNLKYGNNLHLTTESLYIRAFNEKSSLIVTVKDPNIGVKTKANGDFLHFLADFQLMVTKNTISITKIKVVKDTSFFLASGHLLYDKSPDNLTELNVKTRVNANFSDLKKWSNVIHSNNYLDLVKGVADMDINLIKKGRNKLISLDVLGDVNKLQIEKIKIGDINLQASINDIDVKSKGQLIKQVNVKKIAANLVGGNLVEITQGKVKFGESTDIRANLEVKNAQLHSFLRDSGIADIPVWLRVGGQLKCAGNFKKTLKIDCPGAITVKNLKVQNKGRTKNIVTAKKIDVAGTATITEKAITYKANAKLGKSTGESTGIIDFKKGFDFKYKSDSLDLTEVGPIADLKFVGVGKTEGFTKGNSRTATFGMNMQVENFEFENYFFGNIKTNLNYKSGSLYFDPIDGSIESTRYKGNLQVNLLTEMIKGDIQLPFFRMTDIQQSVLKKVDLQDRFLGSGSGRILLDTPFDIDRLNFNLDARLFKGSAFGEEYNEAKLKAQSVDGIIIIQEGILQKETTKFIVKGTIDTELESKLKFVVNDGYLQHSTRLRNYKIPISGQFEAIGKINGPLAKPVIVTSAKIKNLIFNKKKYESALFSYDTSNNQTNLQFNIPEQLELLVVLPESDFKSVFVNATANNFDIAPILGYVVSEEATRSYFINTSGEISGKFDTQNFWNSEFSSTIKNVTFQYKSNKMETSTPTNIELKNGQLFLNEISFVGNRQHIKVTQPYTEKFRTKFVINSRINIAFFKLFAPFIEKIDGYSTLRLELSLNHKSFKLLGSSFTSDSFLKFPGFPHAFENLTADVLFNQNQVLINSLSGELAGGSVLGNGEVKFPGGKKFDLFINTSMEDVNIAFPDGFKTTGSGSISLSGSKPPFLLSGEYNVVEGLIDSNFDQGGSSDSTDLLEELLKQEISSPLILNLDIRTKNPVEVRNNLVEGYILGDIKVFDKIDAPRIKGEAHFDENAIIRFRDQEFEVTSSDFLFEGQTPINPKLSLRAQTRMNSYDINLFLQGRANKPQLTWTSQPPLPETQIVSMLALGTLPDQFDQDNSSQINSGQGGNGGSQGFEVGTSLLSNNPLGRELKERLDVDVQFSSSFDDQNNAAAQKVTLRRKVTKKLQVSVSATTGSTDQQEGRVTYELNNDWSSVFRIQNRQNNINNINNNTTGRQNNPFGIDLEYRKEFD